MAAVSEAAKENQKQYKLEFAKQKYSRIPLDVPKEYHEYIKSVAQSLGMTLNGFIKEAISEKVENMNEEIPPEFFIRLREWFLEHGHTIEDYNDCLRHLGKDDMCSIGRDSDG